MADRGIATRLRFAGVPVKEVDGWKTRGREFVLGGFVFAPEGSVNHHTAGLPKSAGFVAPSLGTIINGRSDLPGPLANVYQDYKDRAHVVAAGVCNHAGLPDGGSIEGMTGNSQAYGLEIEHPGTTKLGMKRAAVAAKIHAALLWRPNGDDLAGADHVVQHWEWAPSRKVDLGTNMHDAAHGDPTADAFRKMVADELERLNGVNRWRIEYEARDGSRKKATVRALDEWVADHPKAISRGKFIAVPKSD